jgi:predicted RNA binding protein YcfA (HicA-like mRNA interferase family)
VKTTHKWYYKEDEMPLSGDEMRKLFEKDGWIFDHQRGSHMILKKDGRHICIPRHKELSKGTEHGLLKKLRSGV